MPCTHWTTPSSCSRPCAGKRSPTRGTGPSGSVWPSMGNTRSRAQGRMGPEFHRQHALQSAAMQKETISFSVDREHRGIGTVARSNSHRLWRVQDLTMLARDPLLPLRAIHCSTMLARDPLLPHGLFMAQKKKAIKVTPRTLVHGRAGELLRRRDSDLESDSPP